MHDERFSDAHPADRLYDGDTDMWVMRDADGRVTVGITRFGIGQAGEIIAFTPKPVGSDVDAGRGFGTVECAKTVLSVRTPVALHIVETNIAAERQAACINRDPHGAGWLVRGVARDWSRDADRLVGAAEYDDRCRQRVGDPD